MDGQSVSFFLKMLFQPLENRTTNVLEIDPAMPMPDAGVYTWLQLLVYRLS